MVFSQYLPADLIMQSSESGDVAKQRAAHVKITNYFVNTIVTALLAPEWETLLGRSVKLDIIICTADICRGGAELV